MMFLDDLTRSRRANSICKTVPCGKGNCTVEQGKVLGYRCECDPGSMQMHVSDSLHFIPSVIPNCKHAENFPNSCSLLPLYCMCRLLALSIFTAVAYMMTWSIVPQFIKLMIVHALTSWCCIIILPSFN
jgi:hypothetical protein